MLCRREKKKIYYRREANSKIDIVGRGRGCKAEGNSAVRGRGRKAEGNIAMRGRGHTAEGNIAVRGAAVRPKDISP